MTTRTWTKEQQEVLRANGNILVSASAGSGKTTVMVEKIKDILLKPVPIESVLVLSYTVASAADMRGKIIKSLYECSCGDFADIGVAEKIKKQIDDIPFSDISTVDSFCTRLIRENFQRLELDSDFSQMDKEESDILKRQTMMEIFNVHKKAKDEVFSSLLTRMSKITSDKDLTDKWLNLYESIYIHPNPLKFIEKIKSDARNGGYNDENQKIIIKYIHRIAKDYRPYAQKLALQVSNDFVAQVKWIGAILYTLDEILKIETFDDWQRAKLNLPSLNTPNRSKNIISEDLCAEITAVRDSVKTLIEETNKYLDVALEGESISESQEQTLKLLDIISEFKTEYDRKKYQLRKLDFLDLSRLAIELLADDNYAEQVQKKFSYIFVDEYQDINPLQEFILQRISNGNNLFMVGDSKQSIYAFRGSDTQILLDKKLSYQSATDIGSAIMLTQNFRSQRKILEFADDMFSVLMTDDTSGFNYADESLFINEKNARSQNMDTVGDDVEICFYYCENTKPEVPVCGVYSVKNHIEVETSENKTAYYEGVGVARKIKELVSTRKIVEDINGEKSARKLDYSDIAILMTKRNASSKIFLRALKDYGIPYLANGFDGVQGEDIVKIIINLVRVLDNSSADVYFVGYLLSYFGGFCEDDIISIRQRTADGLRLNQAVETLSTEEDELGLKCRRAITQLKSWRFEASYKSMSQLLSDIVLKTGFDAYVLARPQGREELYLLDCFLSSLASKDAVYSTTSFLRYFDNVQKMETPEVKLEYGNAVKILTVHGSKGLEFPVVFVCQTNSFKKGAGASDILIDKDIGIGIRIFNDDLRIKQNSVAYNAIEIKHKIGEVVEEIRLFYVALTRAKDMLFISGTLSEKSYNKKTAFTGSIFKAKCFSDFILYAAAINDKIKRSIKLENIEEIQRAKALPTPIVFNSADQDYKKAFEEIISFSYPHSDAVKISPKYTVSELNQLNADGEMEYTPHLYSIDAKERGIAYHAVMESIDFMCDTVAEVQSGIDKLVSQGNLKAEQAELIDAEEILACITNPIIRSGFLKGRIYRERSFMLKLPADAVLDTSAKDDVLIQGTIDLLIVGKENILIDYKNSALIRKNLSEKYKKQLYLYILAVEKAFDIKIDKKYLYSFKEKALIEVE